MIEIYRRLIRRLTNPIFIIGYILLLLFSYLIISDINLNEELNVSLIRKPKFIFYLIGALVSTFLMMSQYLNKNSDLKKESEYILREELKEIKYLINRDRNRKPEQQNKDLFDKISELNNKISEFKEFELGIDDKKKLFKHLETSIKNEISESVIHKVNDIYGSSILENTKHKELRNDFEDIKQRLNAEIRILTKRANTNLAIGTALTVVAGLTLWVTVISENINFTKIIDITSHYIPRISLIIFIEIFAFFFLRLYKTNLNGTRYYHNELTNVDMQITGLKSALISKDPKLLEIVINQFSKTERNFLIPKDSTTLELEKLRTDSIEKNGLVDLLKSLIKKE